MQIQGVIEAVQGRNVGNPPKTIYDVKINGQDYSTFDPEPARVASQMIGQSGTFEVEIKPSRDGQYTNYYYNGLAGAGAALPGQQAIPQPPGIPTVQAVQQPVQQPVPGIPIQPPEQFARDLSPLAVSRITKSAMLDVAFNFVGLFWQGAGPEGLADGEEQALALAKRLYAQVLGAAQTLDDQVVESLVAAAPEQPQQQGLEDWD